MRPLLFGLLGSLLFFSCRTHRLDVSGNWSGTAQVDDTEANKEIPDRSPHSVSLTLSQHGTSVTGSFSPDPTLHQQIMNGMVEGNRLTFQIPQPASHPYRESAIYFDLSAQGNELKGYAGWPTHNKVLSTRISLKRAAEK